MKPKFIRLGDKNLSPQKQQLYMLSALKLMLLYRENLFDDYFGANDDFETAVKNLIKACYPWFWVVVDEKKDCLAGVVYLYNAVGRRGKLHSAYVSTCFRRRYWGSFVTRASRLFFRYVFAKLKPTKLFAEIYSHNCLGQSFVDRLGFAFHSYNIGQTMQNNKPSDTYTAVLFRQKEDNLRQQKMLANLMGT